MFFASFKNRKMGINGSDIKYIQPFLVKNSGMIYIELMIGWMKILEKLIHQSFNLENKCKNGTVGKLVELYKNSYQSIKLSQELII